MTKENPSWSKVQFLILAFDLNVYLIQAFVGPGHVYMYMPCLRGFSLGHDYAEAGMYVGKWKTYAVTVIRSV